MKELLDEYDRWAWQAGVKDLEVSKQMSAFTAALGAHQLSVDPKHR